MILDLPFSQGQHICALYETADEQLDVAATYLADGLARGERCLYVASSVTALDALRDLLQSRGVDAGAAEAGRALLMMTSGEAHLADGAFDSERMLRLLNDALEEALNDGFAGLRTCGDMSWLLDEPPGADQVVEYEAVLNEFFRSARGLGMCQYDVRRMPAYLLDEAAVTRHSSVVAAGRHRTNKSFEA